MSSVRCRTWRAWGTRWSGLRAEWGSGFGLARVEPPQNFAQMCDLADEILPAHVAAAIRRGEPIGDVAFHKYPTSRWRRYDKLEYFPAGIVPFGDAVASFNPTFGQGMTMTSLQAGHLRRALQTGGDLERQLNRATAKTTSGVDDERHRRSRAAQRCGSDAAVVSMGRRVVRPVPRRRGDGSLSGRMVLRRFSLLDSLCMIPSLRLVGRTVRHNMRLWLAERRRAHKRVLVHSEVG